MKLYHTSPIKIDKINEDGLFDDCLFFSTEPYVMTQSDTIYTYVIEIKAEKIINVTDIYDKSIIENIMDVLNVCEDSAEKLLDGRRTAFDYGFDGEDDWWIQAKQGEAAKLLGYEGCKAKDEQGEVYIIPMLGREHDLKLINCVKM